MKERAKLFVYGFILGVIIILPSILVQSCQSEKVYPVLTEEQGDYIRLEFINEDQTVEYSSIQYEK